MESHKSSFQIFCNGYSSSEYKQITDCLTSAGMLSVIHGEDADIILEGDFLDSEKISDQVHQYRLNYPNAAIIRCVPVHRKDSSPMAIGSLFDSYLILDFNSPVWGENLIGIIYQALFFRHSIRCNISSEDQVFKQIFLTNAVPMALSIPDSGLFVEVNDAFLHTLGYSREEVIGTTSYELNIFVQVASREEIVQQFDPGQPFRDREVVIRTKQGQLITGLFSVDRVLRNGKELFLTTMKDISYLKKIESKLRRNSQFIQDILSSVSEGIIVYDSEFKYCIWNQYMQELTGISETDIIGKHASDFRPEVKGDDMLFLLNQALNGITSTSADISFLIPQTGKSGWVSIHYTPFRDNSGNIIGVIASVRDISERKIAEEEVKAFKRLLRSIIDTVPVWIACFDADGKILIANHAFSSGFGSSPKDLEGHSSDELCLGTRMERHISLIKKALSGREIPFNEELENFGPDMRKVFLRGRYSPLKDSDGMITGVVAVIIDISDLRQAQKSLEMINSKLNLLSSITRHDILNSLTGVLGYLTYVEDESDPERRMTYVTKALFMAKQIQEQIEFTRDYQDLGVKEPRWQNASSVFKLAIKEIKKSDVVFHLSLDNLLVYADPLLERVIFNLLDNALRYGIKLTKISSSWYHNDGQVIWVIEDDGVGIPIAMKERIFRKGVGNNTGLGLFLTREILDITGLHIRETGVEEEGARFEIIIPDGSWKKTD